MIIRTNSENKITKEFLLNFTTSSEVTRKLYPNSPKKIESSVQRTFNKLKEAGYLEEMNKPIEKVNNKGNRYVQRIKKYRLNINFFFDYASSKIINTKNKFNSEEKEFIEYIFSFQESKDIIYENSYFLIQGIVSFFKDICFYQTTTNDEYILDQFVKIFFFEVKKKRKKGFYFWVFTQTLKKKIKILSNYKGYEKLLNKKLIKDYSEIPFDVLEDALFNQD